MGNNYARRRSPRSDQIRNGDVVAVVRPLRLKSQLAKAADGPQAQDLPIAAIWVDNGISHLDGTFDYIVPQRLSDAVRVGVRVIVPFAGKEVEGIVTARIDGSTVLGLRSISSLLSPHPVANQESIDLIGLTARRWASHPYDILRSAIPARVASVDKEFSLAENLAQNPHVDEGSRGKSDPRRQYLLCAPGDNPLAQLAHLAITSMERGGVLLLVPEERELREVEMILQRHVGEENFARVDGSMPRSDRYRNHLRITRGDVRIVIGNRSAIFAPVSDLSTIIVYREGAQSHYEVRTPGWNVRDVAILRSIENKSSLFFVGFSPSSEAGRLIESGWLEFKAPKVTLKVVSYPQNAGELLPPRIFAPIRKALKTGPVLFLAPRKGYASALLCKKCRNIAMCQCGGKLFKKNLKASPECSHCAQIFDGWRCTWCQGDTPYLVGRGSERFSEEIGRAFPGLQVHSSSSDNEISEISSQPSLVISTAGMQPSVEGGYSAVVLLEGAAFFGEVDMRSQERARESFFQSASLVKTGGDVLVVIDNSHPITASLSRWNPSIMATRELAERSDAHLPPYFRSAIIDLPASEAVTVVKALERALSEGRLPASSTILGPALREKDIARILITSTLSDGSALVELLHEFTRKRAIARKPSISLRIDPYSLS